MYRQAVDCFLRRAQRFYDPQIHPVTAEVTREERFLNALWDQVAKIHDLYFSGDKSNRRLNWSCARRE